MQSRRHSFVESVTNVAIGYGVALASQLAIREMAERFTATEITPFAAEWDEKHHFPRETIRKAAELRIEDTISLTLDVPEELRPPADRHRAARRRGHRGRHRCALAPRPQCARGPAPAQ